MRLLKTWWMDEPNNYGDILTPYIFDRLGVKYEKASKNNFNCLAVGSIAKFAKANTVVLGSGFMRFNDPVSRHAKYEFVRGPLSRQKIIEAGGKCPEIYGDLACILPRLIEPSPKKIKVGLIPHYVDFAQAKQVYRDFKSTNLDNPDIIAVTKRITECEKIITSSLHGLIVAHAYGIPAAWVKMSDKLAGDGFKFYDYFASIDQEPVLSKIRKPVFTLGKVDDAKIFKIMEKYSAK
jgi:pyruvyltransferase